MGGVPREKQTCDVVNTVGLKSRPRSNPSPLRYTRPSDKSGPRYSRRVPDEIFRLNSGSSGGQVNNTQEWLRANDLLDQVSRSLFGSTFKEESEMLTSQRRPTERPGEDCGEGRTSPPTRGSRTSSKTSNR